MVLGSIFLWPGLAGVISSAGLVAVFAQGMMVSSLLTFEKVSNIKGSEIDIRTMTTGNDH